MSPFRTVSSLAAVLAVSACAEQSGPQSPKNRPVTREGGRSLDAPQSVELVVGNTVKGHYSDTPGTYVDYFAPDGRLVTREPDGQIYNGTWKARYTQFCVQYDLPKPTYLQCFEFAEYNGGYSTFRPGGAGFYDIDSITPGNTEDLPLE